MKTVADLGREIKKKYPGSYDDMSDEELGRKIKAAYPDYSDYQDISLSTPSQHNLQAPFPDEFSFTQQAIEQIKQHYDPHRGRFTSWWQRGKGEGRNKLLTVLNQEQLLVIKNAAILEQQAMASRRAFAEYQTYLIQNASIIHQLKANEQLIEQALEKGFALDPYQEVKKQSELSRIRVEEHHKLKDIDLQARWQEIKQDSDAADLAQLGDYLLVKKLRQELREAREERYAILESNRPQQLKEELIADYDEFISRLKAKIDERETGETGRIPRENGEEKRGAKKEQANSRTSYPSETDED